MKPRLLNEIDGANIQSYNVSAVTFIISYSIRPYKLYHVGTAEQNDCQL